VVPGPAAPLEPLLAASEAGVLAIGVPDPQALSANITTVASARIRGFMRIIIVYSPVQPKSRVALAGACDLPVP